MYIYYIYIYIYIYQNKAKSAFQKQQIYLNKNDGNFYIKSSTKKQLTPKETQHLVETFIKAFKNESEKGGQFPKNNLNENKIEALKDLNIRDDIVITKADKGQL